MIRLDRVVIGVDFSEVSLAAARWASRHFAPEAEPVLVYSIETPPLSITYRAILPPRDKLVALARGPAVTQLAELGRSLGANSVKTVTREGRPAEQIAAVADQLEADLVVVGEHGRHRGTWGGLGSTAEQLFHWSRVPVLLARPPRNTPPRVVLVAVDDSEQTPAVLEWTRFLAGKFQAKLIAVHVLSQVLHGHIRLVSSANKTQGLEEAAQGEARGWLEARLADAGIEPGRVTTEVEFGHPGYEIVAAAERHTADLIVMGSRGAGAIARALVGSVASAVVRRAGSSVLVVVEEGTEG